MLKIKLTNEWQTQTLTHTTGTLEFGRGPRRAAERMVIVQDQFVSRDQMRIEELANRKLRVENLSTTNPLLIEDAATIEPGQTIELLLPVKIILGHTVVAFEVANGQSASQTADQTCFQSIGAPDVTTEIKPLSALGDAPSAVVLATWFETLLSVQQAAVGSDEFYDATARAVVNLIGLDRGIILRLHDTAWQVVASYSRPGFQGDSYSRTILREVCEQQRTLCQTPNSFSPEASLQSLEAVVAAPVFGPGGKLLGAIYGSRDVHPIGRHGGIQPLEAQVVQVLAAVISTGLVRLQREMEAAQARVRFEQFCSPELASELQRNPSLLEGSEREVTVLFTDLRGFSMLSERLAPGPLYRLMGDLMDRLTDCVIAHGGVIVDYYGDGLCAMWDAPADQADHADRACSAALEMLAEMPGINARWAAQVKTVLQIGIGINTGPAQVGNMGGQRRLKYGPRGHTVNLASRVEGSTKHFGVCALLTASTRNRLQRPFCLRRLCQARMVGVAGSVELYELFAIPNDDAWQRHRDDYEQALSRYEQGDLQQCLALLDGLISTSRTVTDEPARLLQRRATACLANPSTTFDPVFCLEAK